jgi:hypothetical protein
MMMNKFKKFDNNILVYSLQNHNKIKDKILSYIDNSNKFSISKNNYAVTATDYMLETHPMDREYYKLIKNETTFFEDIRELYKVQDIQVSNMWYQQYYENDKHEWHYHNNANLLGVYLLEMTNNEGLTEFYDIYENKRINVKAKEGDIILFNSLTPHRSPQLQSKNRKTAISINLNIFDINPSMTVDF